MWLVQWRKVLFLQERWNLNLRPVNRKSNALLQRHHSESKQGQECMNLMMFSSNLP